MRGRLALLSLALALLASPPARASEGTPEEGALAQAAEQLGPLALSGDGQWRVHVDAHNVLHRVNLADPARSQSLALPARIRVVAASRSGQKVALLIERACVGRADFGTGPGAVARVEWRPLAGQDGSVSPWQAQFPAACAERERLWPEPDVVAISNDGRLVATRSEVVDVDAHRVIATLPQGRTHPLLMRFVDGDRRLLVVGAYPGQSEGPGSEPSRLEIATWDLGTQCLHSLSVRELRDGLGVASLLPAYAARTGDVLTSTMTPYREQGWTAATLEAWHVAGCGAAPTSRPPIGDWTSVAVDPAGRWIAGTRPLAHDPAERDLQGGFTNEIVVQDVASGRLIARQAWPHALHGLIANGDGTAVFALVAPPAWHWRETSAPTPILPANIGAVVELRIPAKALAPAAAPAWAAAPCPLPDERPGARDVAHASTVFKPRWDAPLHRSADSRASGDVAAGSTPQGDVPCRGSCSDVFVRTDTAPWVDEGATLTRLHVGTGERVQVLPTPRSDKLASVALNVSGGWFSAQGDTLSWRPFDRATEVSFRQVVDRRPGWEVILLQRQGSTMLAAWRRKAPAVPSYPPRAATYAFYDKHLRLLHESPGSEDAGGDAWPTSEDLQHTVTMRTIAPCHDETGALAEGFDWRIGPLGSVLAWACGPTPGAAHIALWSGSDVAPKPPAVDYGPAFERVAASDGALGVIQDGRQWRHLRVFDADKRRELGTIDTPPDDDIVDIVADDDNGFVLIETTDHAQPGLRHVLAYFVR